MKCALALTVMLCTVCLAGSARATTPFVLQTIDSGEFGNPSLALDSHGNPHICYFDFSTGQLRYASWDACAWGIDVAHVCPGDCEVDASSLAFDAQDNPHLGIYQTGETSPGLFYATRAAGAWTFETVDLGASYRLDIAVDPQGVPHIAYDGHVHDPSLRSELRYATRNAGSWTTEVVDASSWNTGEFISLAIDAAGNPHISYVDQVNGDLKYATRSQGGWSIETVDANIVVPSGFDFGGTSIALDASGAPHISYYDAINDDLKYASRSGGGWSIEPVDPSLANPFFNHGFISLALDGQDNPRISYWNWEGPDAYSGDLKYASRTGGFWATQTVDTGVLEDAIPLALDGPGRPSIAYVDAPYGSHLFFAHVESQPPDCSLAAASEPVLWPPNHAYHAISIQGVTDPDGDPVTIVVTGITQDEPLNSRRDGYTCPDGKVASGQAQVRAERAGGQGIHGNGRVYRISFTACDPTGAACQGSVSVCVPFLQGLTCIDDGQIYNSLGPCGPPLSSEISDVDLAVARVTGNQASIEFELPQDTEVELKVFDLAGRQLATVASGILSAGQYRRSWDMSGAAKGVYFLRLRAGARTLTRLIVNHP